MYQDSKKKFKKIQSSTVAYMLILRINVSLICHLKPLSRVQAYVREECEF